MTLDGAFTRFRRNKLSREGTWCTLEAALWVLLNHRTYADTVLAAVNLGFDTDTTAAVAGGLAALAYGGAPSIPAEWLAVLARRHDIEDLAQRLATQMRPDTTLLPYA